MNKPDLDTVAARRAAVASELAALERMRAEIEQEDQELLVAERVLTRLAAMLPAESSPSTTFEAGRDLGDHADRAPSEPQLVHSAGR